MINSRLRGLPVGAIYPKDPRNPLENSAYTNKNKEAPFSSFRLRILHLLELLTFIIRLKKNNKPSTLSSVFDLPQAPPPSPPSLN